MVIDCLHSKKPERRDSGKPFLQLSNIRDDGLLDMIDSFLISDADYEAWTARMEASPGDCVITNVGRVGAVAQVPLGVRAALGRNMTGVRCTPSFPFPSFLVEALRSDSMKEEIARRTDTGTILNSLNVRSIPRLAITRPPDNVVGAFEGCCRPLRERMERNLSESVTLTAISDFLLPKLMSGEIRVNDAERSTRSRCE
jgi:type I restriction enzyme S subunit